MGSCGNFVDNISNCEWSFAFWLHYGNRSGLFKMTLFQCWSILGLRFWTWKLLLFVNSRLEPQFFWKTAYVGVGGEYSTIAMCSCLYYVSCSFYIVLFLWALARSVCLSSRIVIFYWQYQIPYCSAISINFDVRFLTIDASSMNFTLL